ncbi:MAG: PTS sugar transporter subunit IIA [bacterium]|nr:PTS sugar transporter subunit IIA [bacterium]
MRLYNHLNSNRVLITPDASGRDELFHQLVQTFIQDGLVDKENGIVDRLLEREAILSTGIGGGVAVPHAQIPGLGRLVMAASTHPQGVEYPSLDQAPVRLVFCLLGDASTAAEHLAGLARLARLARREDALDELVAATSGENFLATMRRIEDEA